MNIGNSLYWYVNISVSDKVGRGNNGGVDSDVSAEFRSEYGKIIELEYVDEVGSGDSNSVDTFITGVGDKFGEVFEL